MSTRFQTVVLVALMAIGSLALWIGIPAAWLWLTRHTEPAASRFLLVLAGCAATMLAAAWLLYRLEGIYERVSGGPDLPRPRVTWMRGMSEERRSRRPLSLLDLFLVASAVVALVALVLWWALLADNPSPSGPLQPL